MATANGARFGGLTQRDVDWLNVFKAANPVQARHMAAALDTLVHVLQERGYICASDERADKLRAGIARYIAESQQ